MQEWESLTESTSENNWFAGKTRLVRHVCRDTNPKCSLPPRMLLAGLKARAQTRRVFSNTALSRGPDMLPMGLAHTSGAGPPLGWTHSQCPRLTSPGRLGWDPYPSHWEPSLLRLATRPQSRLKLPRILGSWVQLLLRRSEPHTRWVPGQKWLPPTPIHPPPLFKAFLNCLLSAEQVCAPRSHRQQSPQRHFTRVMSPR